jgi:hypothetical protein
MKMAAEGLCRSPFTLIVISDFIPSGAAWSKWRKRCGYGSVSEWSVQLCAATITKGPAGTGQINSGLGQAALADCAGRP